LAIVGASRDACDGGYSNRHATGIDAAFTINWTKLIGLSPKERKLALKFLID
jgi:hypothetical protein